MFDLLSNTELHFWKLIYYISHQIYPIFTSIFWLWPPQAFMLKFHLSIFLLCEYSLPYKAERTTYSVIKISFDGIF